MSRRILKTSCDMTTGVVSAHSNGYARCYSPELKRTVKAHRYVWEKEHGAIPEGYVVMHTCDNRACTNIDHLTLGTQSENMKDMYNKNRQGDRHLPSGETHHATTVTESDVKEFRSTPYKRGLYYQWAKIHGVSRQTARNIYTGKTWSNYEEPDLSDLV